MSTSSTNATRVFVPPRAILTVRSCRRLLFLDTRLQFSKLSEGFAYPSVGLQALWRGRRVAAGPSRDYMRLYRAARARALSCKES